MEEMVMNNKVCRLARKSILPSYTRHTPMFKQLLNKETIKWTARAMHQQIQLVNMLYRLICLSNRVR